jgi:hypothetical protein
MADLVRVGHFPTARSRAHAVGPNHPTLPRTERRSGCEVGSLATKRGIPVPPVVIAAIRTDMPMCAEPKSVVGSSNPVEVASMNVVPFRWLVFGLLATASVAAGCSSSNSHRTSHASPASNDLAWAMACVPQSFGPVTRAFDGLTVAAARAQARHDGEVMDFLAADGSCDIGRIPITAGPTYVHAAIAKGRVVFARVAKLRPRPSSG